MSAQNVYSYSTPLGQAGGLVDLSPYAIDAYINEADDGAMKFGMGVVRGVAAGACVALPGASSTAEDFEGIVNNRRTSENGIYGGVSLRKNCTVGVMRFGRIYGLLANGVKPAYGDKVYLVVSGDDAGCFSNVATDNLEIKARFRSAASDGIAAIELFYQAQA